MVPERYIRKQTLANCERYITQELKEMESTVLGAAGKLTALEYSLFVAVRDAVANAEANGIKNIRFFAADAGAFMDTLAKEGEHIDVVITDPPRAGCSAKFLKSLIALAPKRVVYISCNPETLARDLYTLRNGGYSVKKIQPVDMFPFTAHCECAVELRLVKAK